MYTTKMADLESLNNELQQLHNEVCELHTEYENAANNYNNTNSSENKRYLENAYKLLERKRKEFNDLCTMIHRLEREQK